MVTVEVLRYRHDTVNERGNSVGVWDDVGEGVVLDDATLAPRASREASAPGLTDRVITDMTLMYRDPVKIGAKDRVWALGRLWMVDGEAADYNDLDPFGPFDWGGSQVALKEVR